MNGPMKLRSGAWLVLTGLAVAVLSGCNRANDALAEVRGRITHGGEPMANVSIRFRPLDLGTGKRAGPGSYAITDSDGRYALRTMDSDRTGAVVGRHHVSIDSVRPEGLADNAATPIDPRIPAAFRNDSVTIDVPPIGLSNADFDLAKY